MDHRKKDRNDPKEGFWLEQLREDCVEGSAKDELLKQSHRDSRPQRGEENPEERFPRVEDFVPAEPHVERTEKQ